MKKFESYGPATRINVTQFKDGKYQAYVEVWSDRKKAEERYYDLLRNRDVTDARLL